MYVLLYFHFLFAGTSTPGSAGDFASTKFNVKYFCRLYTWKIFADLVGILLSEFSLKFELNKIHIYVWATASLTVKTNNDSCHNGS